MCAIVCVKCSQTSMSLFPLNTVQDVKFQAQTPEEKEAWIKALSEGINKAKNKILDQVKVDGSCSLEHVTLSRPKRNRGRRPPTRIHMKEAANISSDGILRLDLEGDVTIQNETHTLNTEGDKQTETLKSPVTLNDIAEEDNNEDSTPQKKIIKPPMLPLKDNKPSDSHKEDEPINEEPIPQKKILMPSMPPSKENKPNVSVDGNAVGEISSDEENADISEPTPSIKNIQPPAPPSKHMKPSQMVIPATVTTEGKETQEKDEEVDGNDTEVDSASDTQKRNEKEDQVKTEEVETFTLSSKLIKPQVVMWDSPTIASKEPPVEQEGQNSKKASDTTGEVTTLIEPHQLNVTPVSTPEAVKKSPGPLAPPKKKPLKPPVKKEDTPPQSEPMVITNTSTSSSERVLEQSLEKDDIKLTNPESKTEPGGDMLSEEVEKKSLDSGQHSGEESESGDQVTPSTAKLKGSSQGLDGETSEDDLEPSDSKAESLEEPSIETPTTAPENSVLNTHPTPSQCANKSLHLTMPLKHSSKARSASLGDLPAKNTEKMEGKVKEIPIKPHGSDVKDLPSKMSFEIEETEELLNAIATGKSMEFKGGAGPEILLTAAMVKLRKADQFLREARNCKDHNKSNRLSW
ncbi:proteoglycan 4-like isoform X2 [Myxocyprinus asiaticus]|uniref:proteoglycan 4-like isoform X2 n=1 Tax=Myxocyprinus asiaticus TaxID=70543 RepID=UPI002221E1F8|nr:proteoglycan 4-like isoform X2 [Myxocyprinus asiaticus]XP_051561663.1 proteoglycan 4-like isoform X2 [Myxocyprinus asiaticus]XP_051561670.1 proteoglycan 4-like isoform X2 [Myxocyprinus asiaticus]XP_051561675.1 proteoglycan 4-like isoform X2 [Myxocyprinus asiaticus]